MAFTAQAIMTASSRMNYGSPFLSILFRHAHERSSRTRSLTLDRLRYRLWSDLLGFRLGIECYSIQLGRVSQYLLLHSKYVSYRTA
jgi:hypothetical protein